MQTADGRGVVNVLAADKLMSNPRLYSSFLLWLLSELFENLPEVGDRDKPKLVFFFDEAHLLFSEAPPALLEKVEQVVRLIRSKGVGVYFVTQNPLDIPEKVLGQLGNRVQHALRAFTPRDQKAVKSVAETMRANPKLDVQKAILELGVGEALVSLLDAKGTPGITERAWVLAPGSQLGPITPEDRRQLIAQSVVAGVYEKTVDRESAYEKLKGAPGGATPAPAGKAGTAPAQAGGGIMDALSDVFLGKTGPRGGHQPGVLEAAAKSAARSVGSQVGREIVRGVLGGLLGGGKRRR
jgi:DNA helicase HerA-like ATPase